MNKMKVRIKEPIIRDDGLGNILDVSERAFKENPKKVYTVPYSQFWLKYRDAGLLIEVGRTEDEEENPKSEKPKEGKNEK